MKINQYLAERTLEPIKKRMSLKGLNVLEVGAGDCVLSKLLSENGAQVWAVDGLKPDRLPASIEFLHRIWPDFSLVTEDNLPPMDLVVFSRSLHLISDLEDALKACKLLLKEEGQVCVESFAFSETYESTIAWVYHQVNYLESRSIANQELHDFYRIVKSKTSNPNKKLWMESNSCFSHSAITVAKALRRNFHSVEELEVPFFYRHFATMMLDQNCSDAIDECYRRELSSIAIDELQAIGRHWWCKNKI